MAATDPYASNPAISTYPARGGESITASDSNEFNQVSRGIYVGGAGDIALVMADDTALTFVGVVAGTVIPVMAKQVKATGTTATSMIALY